MWTLIHPKTTYFKSNSHTAKTPSPIRFTSVYATMAAPGMADKYYDSFEKHTHELATAVTALFREPECCKAIAMLLKDSKPTAVISIGSADGSEIISYGIYASLNNIPFTDPQQLKFIAVEPHPGLHAVNKTGYLVCGGYEQEWVNQNILNGEWNKYLVYSKKPPKAYPEILKDYPEMAEYTHDSVAGISIGKGMEWYKVNRKTVPPVYVHKATMENYVKKPLTSHQRQIYILANSWAYLVAKPTKNSQDIDYTCTPQQVENFIDIIKNIKAQNKGKEVLMVLGAMEKRLLQERMPWLGELVMEQGMKPLSSDELKQAGISLDKEDMDELQGKIWKLST